MRQARLVWCAIAAGLAWAAPATAGGGPLYDVLPEYTVVAVYTDKPSRALPRTLVEPLLLGLQTPRASVDDVLDVLPRLPGPLLAAAVLKPGAEGPPHVLIAAELGRPPADVDRLLKDKLLPLLRVVIPEQVGPGLTVEESAPLHRIRRGDAVLAAYAVKEGRVLLSDDPTTVHDWLRGEFPRQAWVAQARLRDWFGRLPKKPTLRVLFNPAPLIGGLPRLPRNDATSLLLHALAPQDLTALAGDVSWDRDGLVMECRVALAGQTGGIARLASATPTRSRCLGCFPADFTAVGRIGWPSAAALVQGLYGVLDRIDPAIGAEYRTELADLKAECGVQFDAELLANLVHEVAFGMRVDFARPNPVAWAIVAPLADEPAFAAALDRLLTAFDAPVEVAEVGGRKVLTGQAGVQFVMTAAQGRFVIADSAVTLGELGGGPSEGSGGVPQNEAVSACLEALSSENTACVVVNLGSVGRAIGPMAAALGPARNLVSRGSVGLSLGKDGLDPRLRLTWLLHEGGGAGAARQAPGEQMAGDEAGAEVIFGLAASVLAPSMQRARELAKRTVSASNMRAIGQGLNLYAREHKKFPDDLAELLRRNLILLDQFRNVYDDSGPTSLADFAEKCPFVYRAGLGPSSDPREVVLVERVVRMGEGANCLFVDGHVEFVREPLASQFIAQIEAGAPSVRLP